MKWVFLTSLLRMPKSWAAPLRQRAAAAGPSLPLLPARWLSRLAPSRAVVAASLRDGLTVVRLEPPAAPGGRLRVVHASHHADVVAGARALRLAGLLRGASQLLLLPTALRTFHSLPRPQVPEAELAEATRWQLAPNLDFAPEQALVQVLPLPALSDNPTLQLLAVLAHGPAVREHLAPLHEAGWAPDIVDIEETAQRNLMLLAAPGASAGLTAGACVGFADNEALITLAAGGELCLTRSFTFDALDSSAAAERLALQLQRALDGFERQTTRFAVKSVLLLPGPLGSALPAALAGQITQRLNPMALTELFELTDGAAAALEEPALFAHLLGSAAGRLVEFAPTLSEDAVDGLNAGAGLDLGSAASAMARSLSPAASLPMLTEPYPLSPAAWVAASSTAVAATPAVEPAAPDGFFMDTVIEADQADDVSNAIEFEEEDFNTRLQRQAREALVASDTAQARKAEALAQAQAKARAAAAMPESGINPVAGETTELSLSAVEPAN